MSDKKKVLWGTGLVASKYVGYHGSEDIAFFIDNNPLKRDTEFFKKRVSHPSQILDWTNLFVLIPYNYYDEISAQLKRMGLQEKKDFNVYGIENTKEYTLDDAWELENALKEVETRKEDFKNRILIFGLMAAHDKGICSFLNQWNEFCDGKEFALFSEAVWIPEEQTALKFNFPIYVLPDLFDEKRFPVNNSNNSKEMFVKLKEYVENDECLHNMAISLRKQFINMQIDYEYYFVYQTYFFFKKIIRSLSPKRVVMWCSYGALHTILGKVCGEEDIPQGYMHPGVLPGTFSLDVGGEVGGSYPAVYSNAFHSLHVNKVELEYAEQVWSYLKESRVNTKIQPQNDVVKKIKDVINPEWPIVFYAGQNDYNSGIQVYDEKAREYHSPIFKTSMEALLFLGELAERKKWNLIYKPHPVMEFYMEEKLDIPPNVIYIDRADINEIVDFADVTITILSQTAYVALIREKPVVMLGYIQLKGKGCTYEAFEKDSVEEQIEIALKEGFSRKQRQEFCQHIAQLIKYYLYDDLTYRDIRYGKKLPVRWEQIEEFSEELRIESIIKQHPTM